MKRRLIIDGNAVYELDEECMLKKRLDKKENEKEEPEDENKTEAKQRKKM